LANSWRKTPQLSILALIFFQSHDGIYFPSFQF
jgi:hypothetical protein